MAVLKIKDEQGNVIEIPSIRGKSAYEYAVEAGYTGTEEEFAEKMYKDYDLAEEISQISQDIENIVSDTMESVVGGTESISEPLEMSVTIGQRIEADGSVVNSSSLSYMSGNVVGYKSVDIHVYSHSKAPNYLFLDTNGNVISCGDIISGWNDVSVEISENATTLILNIGGSGETVLSKVTATATKEVVAESSYKVKYDGLTAELRYTILNHPRPVQFGKVAPRANTVYSIVADCDITYASIWRELYKVDWTKEHTPTFISMNCTPTGANATDLDLDESGGYSKYYNGGAGWLVRSLALTDDYIYGAMRYSGGVKVDEQLYYGGLAIIRKSDFTVAKTIWTKTINSRVAIHGNILALGNQMHGLQFYDITIPENLVLRSEILYNYTDSEGNTVSSSTESQSGEFLELDESLYYINMGFAEGFVIYNIDDIENPTEVARWKFADSLGWTGVHTYDKVISYPYMYITVAYNGTDKLVEKHPDKTGVITIDISDITNPTMLDVCTIRESDVCAFNTVGDTKPTEIRRFNNTLVANYEDGILEFLIAEDGKSCTYLGKFKPTSNYGAYALCTLEDGRFFAGGMNDDSIGTVYLYRGL